MAARTKVIILMILSATMIFSQNCENPGFRPLDSAQDFSSSARLSLSQNMARPSFKKLKVGVFYTPYNKISLGYEGGRPAAYQGQSIHDYKKKPFYQWPAVGSVMYAEMPWLGTFNIEGRSVANPVVAELPAQQVFKYHAQWLYNMGADFIIWDSTNHAWLEKNLSDESLAMVRDPLVKLLDSWLELRKQGVSTPQVALWAPIPGEKKGTYFIKTLLEVIETPKYADLIFQYKGKPLLLVVSSGHPDIARLVPGKYYEPDPTILAELSARYTVREMWANELSGGNKWSYLQKCTDGAGGEVTPYRNTGECNQRVSPDPSMQDRVEQIPVTLAYARDHISNRQSATPKRKGYTVLRQLETVYKNIQNVDIVTLSWFNTWAAVQVSPLCIPDHGTGLYNCLQSSGRDAYAQGVSLPQASNGGATLGFTDDYDEEYSVTFEPGGVTGDYYIRLITQALAKVAAGRNPMELYDPEIFTMHGSVSRELKDSTISGWACLKGSSNSIEVSLRSSQGEIAKVRADQDLDIVAGESASEVQARCESSRRYHGFVYKLTEAQKKSLAGAAITVTGLTESEYFADTALSGSVTIPNSPPKSEPLPVAAPTSTPVCTPNTSASCSVVNGTGSKICNSAGSAYGLCTVVKCNTGFVLNGGVCVTQSVTPPPVAVGNIMPIYRYRNTSEMGHIFVTSAMPPGSQYVSEGIAYNLYDQAATGRRAIYRCKIYDSSREFQSTLSHCEGQQSYGVLGYANTEQGAAIYRCFHKDGGHLITTNRAECDFSGYAVEGILGYSP